LRKLLVCAALVCVAFARAFGQEAEESKNELPSFVRLGDAGAEAARLLKSSDNKERAWGAYLVGLHRLKNQTPSLVSLLEDESLNGGGNVESALRQTAFDSLIRLDAEVPSETLLPLYQSSPDEVLILLAREPKKNSQALLGLFTDDATDERWLAIGNLLAEAPAQGFAARLLGGLKIEASVYIYDREGDHNLYGGDNGGHGCGVGGGVDETLPPIFYYHLTTNARRGVTVFATGPRTVYYERTLWGAYCGDDWRALERDFVRVEYLAGLLGATEDNFGLDARPFREVVCKDAAQCRKALASLRDEIRRAYSSALARLLKEGLLDAAETAELKPDITLDITDARDKKSFPLPDKLRGVKLTFTSYKAEPEAPADDEGEPPPDTPR
jgi:hypothetical protein